jgi:hypothetical protein
MLSRIHVLTEKLTAATAPIFMEHKTYDDILAAMCLLMARIVQSTPEKGQELQVLDNAQNQISHALTQFLKLEEQIINARAAERDRARKLVEDGIAGFGDLTVVNGNEFGPAFVGKPVAIEAETTLQIDDRLPEDDEFPDSFEATSSKDQNDMASDIEDGYNPDGPRSYAQGT